MNKNLKYTILAVFLTAYLGICLWLMMDFWRQRKQKFIKKGQGYIDNDDDDDSDSSNKEISYTGTHDSNGLNTENVYVDE